MPLGGVAAVDRLTVWILADNYFDTLLPDSEVAQRYRLGPGPSVHAQHGLACCIESVVDGRASLGMFDFGVDGAGVLVNAGLLGLDLGRSRAFALSHGHFDHYQGLLPLLTAVRPGGSGRPLPFYVGAEAFARRYSLPGWAPEAQDLGALDREAVQAAGMQVVEVDGRAEMLPGVYVVGPIPRRTEYEVPGGKQLVDRGAGPEPDDFRGEIALCAVVRGKGLVVLSGCAHTGIVNTVWQARAATGCERVHAIVGGFHLVVAGPELVGRTVADIVALQPDHVIPGHCTGGPASEALRAALPGAFTLSAAATRLTFSAPD
jgi:7,8-dihydropterin-6-yl-methyl-4-(beta-D-ribofuranosyl)aminobenzene 5'-phosphate synthase